MTDRSSEYTDIKDYVSDPAIDALDKVVASIQKGRELKPDYAKIAALISNQEEKARLIDNIILTHEFARLTKFLRARDRIEQILLMTAERGELTPTEIMAFLTWMTGEMKSMLSRVSRGSNPAKDILELLSKVDATFNDNESKLAAQFSETTPHAREIARRIVYRFNKISEMKRAKVTAQK
jgi:hypothetical protein